MNNSPLPPMSGVIWANIYWCLLLRWDHHRSAERKDFWTPYSAGKTARVFRI